MNQYQGLLAFLSEPVYDGGDASRPCSCPAVFPSTSTAASPRDNWDTFPLLAACVNTNRANITAVYFKMLLSLWFLSSKATWPLGGATKPVRDLGSVSRYPAGFPSVFRKAGSDGWTTPDKRPVYSLPCTMSVSQSDQAYCCQLVYLSPCLSTEHQSQSLRVIGPDCRSATNRNGAAHDRKQDGGRVMGGYSACVTSHGPKRMGIAIMPAEVISSGLFCEM
ncbi:hypothetical protein PoB_006630300 [Plakobranchus ocellatus]|uniref:Uncharacterized protein n=1 Tax=Plakobranchus ocellatus TaxID=259542 RepID=A0AAV4D6M0_9GAST|nr:hypothetical protein PoB_006630300 [Plakobranchus ocellatus]